VHTYLKYHTIPAQLYLNPASVEFAEDLPAAGRCKAARAQTYYDTSSLCQHRRFGKIGAP